MRWSLKPPTPRFHRSALRGRCRRNLFAGLVLSALAAGYGSWAGSHFRTRGADEATFDRPLVLSAARMVRTPKHLASIQPRNDRELYLVTVVSDQHDVMFGLVVLALRMIAALTIGGLGLVLLTTGATEWEIRSETATSPPPPVATQ